MDFNFVDEAAPGGPVGQQQPRAQPHATADGAPPRRLLIQVPSWQEVQAAAQPSAPTMLFRPSGLVAAARQQQPQPQPRPQHRQPYMPATAAAAHAQPPHGAAPPHVQHGPPAAPTWHTNHGPHGAQGAQAWPPGPGRGGAGPGHGPGPGPSTGGPSAFSYGGGPAAGLAPTPAPAFAAAPRPPAAAAAASPPPNVVLVNRRQQGNPVLRHIRNVRWQLADIVPDYQLGANTAALFLSLRYHLLHPEYILHRIREQQRLFRLTVLLVHVDTDDPVKALGEVTRAAVAGDCTLVCAWSPEECARWLETYKSYETKPASSIQERVEPDYVSRLVAVLAGSVRGINRTDAHTLGSAFGSLGAMLRCADAEAFSACPGIGPTKVRRLLEAFHEPFRKQLKMTGLAGPTAAAAAGAAAAGTASAPGAAAGAASRSGAPPAGGGAGSAGAAAAASGTPNGSGQVGQAEGRVQQGTGGPAGPIGVQPGNGQAVGAAVASAQEVRAAADRVRSVGSPSEAEEGASSGNSEEEDEGIEGEDLVDDSVEPEDERAGPLGGGGGIGGGLGVGGGSGDAGILRREQLIELLMSQMPAGDDDVSDVDEETF